MIEGLVGGKLCSCPEQRTGRTGEYTVAKVRALNNGEVVVVSVTAFDLMAQVSLLALNDGDAVAVVGRLTPRAWLDREGEAQPALSVVAKQVLTPYQAKRKRDALAADPDLDEFHEDYDWLERAAA